MHAKCLMKRASDFLFNSFVSAECFLLFFFGFCFNVSSHFPLTESSRNLTERRVLWIENWEGCSGSGDASTQHNELSLVIKVDIGSSLHVSVNGPRLWHSFLLLCLSHAVSIEMI
ncbi:uncharacterized protein LOC122041237 isoform X2 [Zingiber officinale]|uniref:uncharacterized protein LOC122041237 isoform X2 n=1 Tax=Zingiber officinale TaxID=94328 RepID=UPI001C4D9FE3|nr:uncharacterized protein LOC122041237 isoform X2 [Zingiber officinale]